MPLLFSYGSLQLESVQLATFGRKLERHADRIVGFERSRVPIEDPAVVAAIGMTHHQNVTFNGNASSWVEGTVFEITEMELENADKYEQASKYKRVAVRLASGRPAWVYVDARPVLEANP